MIGINLELLYWEWAVKIEMIGKPINFEIKEPCGGTGVHCFEF